MLNVEYSHVVCCANYGTIARVGHELDREDVGSVAGGDTGGQFKLRSGIIRLIGMDVDVLIV